MKRAMITLFFFISVGFSSAAQQPDTITQRNIRASLRDRIEQVLPDYNADSVRRALEKGPYFTLFKDNYFIGGIPIEEKITAANSNAKFRLSIKQKLTRSNLPFDTYLFIHFTQTTIWNIVEESMPVRDLNFNPGVGLGHLIIYKNRYIGEARLMLEHESNGKDGINSRSWNKVSLGANLMFHKNMDAQLKLWVPVIDSDYNRDIMKYNGIGHFGIHYHSNDNRFIFGVLSTWRTNSFSFNTQCDLSFKIHNNENQYLFIQYYNGYGENLLDYNKYKSVVRIGFVIKPQGFSLY